jgi:hypothetical protein
VKVRVILQASVFLVQKDLFIMLWAAVHRDITSCKFFMNLCNLKL